MILNGCTFYRVPDSLEIMKIAPSVPSVKPLSKVPSMTNNRTIYEDAPSVADSEVSYDALSDAHSMDEIVDVKILTTGKRLPLQWEFHGLTLWVEFEEFDSDLTNAIQDASSFYGTEAVPKPHATAIYGMKHLSVKEARDKLHQIPKIVPQWPIMEPPVAVKQDVAVEGRPGQVCSIAWAELTLSSNEKHEAALDEVYRLFDVPRKGPWTPHISLAYDNPEETVLNLGDTVAYMAAHPTLLVKKRKVEAISLWSTQGKMADWKCIDKVHF